MATYPDNLSVAEGRARYFAANGFGDGGYEARWVKLMAGPVPLYLPNTAGRVRAVRLHDIHHVVTGYDTTWTGEAEIAAWEIASSCADHYAAWVLNLQALAIGLAVAPGATARAFLRGRAGANLYRESVDERLLAAPIGAVRQRLRLDAPVAAPRLADCIALAGWAGLSVVTLLATAGLLVAPLVLLVTLVA